MATKLAAARVEHEQWIRTWVILHRPTHANYFYFFKKSTMYTLQSITLDDFQNLSVVISAGIVLKIKQNC